LPDLNEVVFGSSIQGTRIAQAYPFSSGVNMPNFNPLYDALASIGFTDPIHPAIVHMPIGLVAGTLIFGITALVWKRNLFGVSAQHCLILAWLFLFPSVFFGFLDWQHYYQGAWIFPIKIKIALSGILFLLLSAALILILKGLGESKIILAISAIAFATVVVLGYYGGQMVFADLAPAIPQDLRKGEKIYNEYCRACHPDGRNVFMPNIPIRGSGTLTNFQAFNDFIRHPRLASGAQGAMPNFHYQKISEREAKALYNYVKQTFGSGG
jgi:uncharacterized membrane protein